MKKSEKQIDVVCLDCGKKNDNKHKSSFGVWFDNCDMCGKKNVPCADAAHDFGIYSSNEKRDNDLIQDLL